MAEEEKQDSAVQEDTMKHIANALGEQDWRVSAIERKFRQIDKALEKASYVLYGVAIGLIIALIIEL